MQGNDVEFIDISDSNISYFIRCEHLARYIYASEQIRKRKARYVLDAACGSGYGSVEIAKYANRVISIDKNTPFPQYQKPNIEYIHVNLNNDDFSLSLNLQKKLDAIVCFETLEHLDNPEDFLLSLAKIIKKNGLLFVSVPNGDFEKTDKNNELINPYHLHKFHVNDISNLLTKCGFEIKRTLYQSTSAQLYRNQARALRDLKLNKDFAQKMSSSIEHIHYYSRIYAWPDENKCQSYSIMLMCEKSC